MAKMKVKTKEDTKKPVLCVENLFQARFYKLIKTFTLILACDTIQFFLKMKESSTITVKEILRNKLRRKIIEST